MSIKFPAWGSLLVILAASVAFESVAAAQTQTPDSISPDQTQTPNTTTTDQTQTPDTTTTDQTQTPNTLTTKDAFERAYFSHDPDFYTNNSSLERQLDWFAGIGFSFGSSFPENEINRDATLLHTLYHDVLKQQADQPIRTRDLPSPYNSSVMNSPSP